jgi:hypothetical protein
MPHGTWTRGAADRPDRRAASVVRLFPDYAGSVLWLPNPVNAQPVNAQPVNAQPVNYSASGLDAALVTDLIRWEIAYYDALDADFDWRSAALASAFTADGVALALRLAVQLGAGFDIEFASYEAGVATRRFRSELPADNPRAAAVFTALTGPEPRPAPSLVRRPALSSALLSRSPR